MLDEKGISRFALLQDALSGRARQQTRLLRLRSRPISTAGMRQVQLVKRKALLAQLLSGHATGRSGDPAQRPCRRRRQRALRTRIRAGPGGHRLQARFRGLPERPLQNLDQDEGAPGRRFRHRRLHDVESGRRARLPRPRRMGGRRTALPRQGRYRLRQRHAARAAQEGLEPLRAGAAPLDGAPKDIIWVRPVHSAHIHYSNRTSDNLLRHSVFKGLRDVELSAPAANQRRASDLGGTISQRSGSPTRRGACSANPARPSSISLSTTPSLATSCCPTSWAGRCRSSAARPA